MCATCSGHKTIESETAEEGLKLALEKSPALILMDIQLPGMAGITALKQLRANPQTMSIPVIAITASAMTYNRQTMLAQGFDGYQSKPISVKDFLGEIERVLASRASLSVKNELWGLIASIQNPKPLPSQVEVEKPKMELRHPQPLLDMIQAEAYSRAAKTGSTGPFTDDSVLLSSSR